MSDYTDMLLATAGPATLETERQERERTALVSLIRQIVREELASTSRYDRADAAKEHSALRRQIERGEDAER